MRGDYELLSRLDPRQIDEYSKSLVQIAEDDADSAADARFM